MGLFDLPAPLFSAVDHLFGLVLPAFLRLTLWGTFAGWLTMLAYRKISNQKKISTLKAEQKIRQKEIAGFDGEFEELMPLIRSTLGLGFRQLGLAIGPALLATIPVLFIVVWVSGQFGYLAPERGSKVRIHSEPAGIEVQWLPGDQSRPVGDGWLVNWPAPENPLSLQRDGNTLLTLPTSRDVPIIHKKKWWNILIGNPIGYLPEDAPMQAIHMGLQPQQIIGFGPAWTQGWMFTFFLSFLLASLAFKFLLKID